ncbi:MAG: 1-(5-phosphoribosyl)-5-[(5-phosphoribosylamino)methylideneamino]imidazole-4-carboxamide isomerase [Bacteroidota bacterium]|nr:1-(5-phosphoribosyl)-5-[(5-phosphoribosylamino)methylideneamino]imidazole-4-carboxamide isomerase [Bacteroidota bacterium]
MIQIIPAIDIIGGKCVRLSQGDYSSAKQYYDNPLDVAMMFEDNGIKRLHMVDLDGAKEKKIINYKVLEKVASKTSLHIDFGGGIQSDNDLKIAFESGARQITGGSIAVKNKDLFGSWLKSYGSEKIILGADTKDKMIAISGWQEKSEVHLFDLCEYYLDKGINYCISTDVAKDGMLQGPSFDLYKEMQDRFPNLQIIASGGVSQIKDIEMLSEMKIYGVIIGKAIYEGNIKLSDLKPFIS